jgi:hypothetical protein
MGSPLFLSVECAHVRMKVIKEVKREVKRGWAIYLQEVETVINKC